MGHRRLYWQTTLVLMVASWLGAQEPKKYPVVVTPGTPSIWSMEQAHYLLNRLRANNDGLKTTTPSPGDLDPNATNGIRLDALQTTLNVSAAFNQVDALKNQASLKQFQQDSGQRTALLKQISDLQASLYRDQLSLAALQGQQTKLKELQAANPTPAGMAPTAAAVQLARQIADIDGKVAAATAKNTATQAQIDALTKLAGQSPTLALNTTAPPDTLKAPDKVLATTIQSLLTKAADGFTQPKLAASIVLDNALRMQYEILAKQLTILRDEAGMGQRIIFLEMPTSISSADRRILGSGGEDKLAQSWWRVNRIFRQYKTQDSPCWDGEEMLPEAYNIDVVDQTTETPGKMVRIEKSCPASASPSPVTHSAVCRKDGTYTPSLSGNPAFAAVVRNTTELSANYQLLIDRVNNFARNFGTMDPAATETVKDDLQESLKDLSQARSNLLAARAAILANPPNRPPAPYSQREAKVGGIESGCRMIRIESDRVWDQVKAARANLDRALSKATDKQKDLAGEIGAWEKNVLKELDHRLSDLLIPSQAAIWGELGGPLQLTSAFISDIELDRPSGRPEDAKIAVGVNTGSTRAVELIPSQSALNVNTAHSLTSTFSLSVLFNLVFGFGAKGDYQRQREQYDQFLQQEVFASAFGKGQATFGWTFGPLPGSRILNTGIRSTYAVLAVPDDTTALELEGLGCAFRRKADPPPAYPYDLTRDGEFHCGTPLRVRIGVPDQMNSGAFWLTDVQYEPADAGAKVPIILRGRYFSPQTTVLVNGHRLTQVVGVGKPLQKIDDGPDDPADDSAISGTFEYVNHNQMALSLAIPKGYSDGSFPTITLVSPSKVMNINHLTLNINGKRTNLADPDQSLLPLPPTPTPTLALTDWQFFGVSGTTVSARLVGKKLTTAATIWLNGAACGPSPLAPLNDTTVYVTCPDSYQPNWEFLAASNDTDVTKRKAVSISVANPRLIQITSASVMDGSVLYDKGGHPATMKLRLLGVGLTPLARLGGVSLEDADRFILSFTAVGELQCEIRSPRQGDAFRVELPGLGQSASVIVPVPPDKDPAPETSQTTITKVQSEKTVVKK